MGKWVNADNFIFVQLDDLEAPTAVRYFGVGSIGIFCAETQPSTTSPTTTASTPPSIGKAQPANRARRTASGSSGSRRTFETRDGRQIVPGVDREFSPTPPPVCGEVAIPSPAASSASVAVIAREWFFEPTSLHVSAGQSVALSVTNAGEQLQTFTAPKTGIDTGPLQPAATRELMFTAPPERGTYQALCTFPGHEEAGIIGSLVVE